MTPSTAQHGTISTIVPMVSHVDHTEHDVQVIVTGRADWPTYADSRPRQRAHIIIEKRSSSDTDLCCSTTPTDPSGCRTANIRRVLAESVVWHNRYLRSGKRCAFRKRIEQQSRTKRGKGRLGRTTEAAALSRVWALGLSLP